MISKQYNARTTLKLKEDNMSNKYMKAPTQYHSLKAKTDRLNKMKLETQAPLDTPNKCRKLHNCLVNQKRSTPKYSQSNLKFKSVSLVELNCEAKMCTGIMNKGRSKEDGDETKIKHILQNKDSISYLNTIDNHGLAKKVCKMFILNAWRQCRRQTSTLRHKVQTLENEVENQNVQMLVLKNLLQSEMLRVAVARSDSDHLRQRLEDELKNIKNLRKDISELETEKSVWEEMQRQMDSEMKGVKKELASAVEKIKVLNEECVISHSNFIHSRDRESKLLNKMKGTELLLTEMKQALKDKENNFADSQSQIEELMSQNCKLQKENENKETQINCCMERMKKMDEELNDLQNASNVLNENLISLKKDFTEAKEEIRERDKDIYNLNSKIKMYKSEKKEIEAKFLKMRNEVIFRLIRGCASLFLPHY